MKPYKGKIPWVSDRPLDYWTAQMKTAYNYASRKQEDIIFRDNTPFFATLALSGVYRGRSAAGFIWQDEVGQRFIMRLSCMEDLLRRGRVSRGIAAGDWAFSKQGSNFSLMLVEP